MLVFRTKILNGVIWLVAASQLLLHPASEMLHFGCEGHSHGSTSESRALDFWHALNSAWHWFGHAHGCQHTHGATAAVSDSGESAPEHRESRCCCSGHRQTSEARRTHAVPTDAGGGHPDPPHDSHQCPVCQVVFAARISSDAVQLPTQVATLRFTLTVALPVVDVVPHFQLPMRGPPTA